MPSIRPILALLIAHACTNTAAASELRGLIVDSETKKPLAARVYIHDANGQAFFVSGIKGGTAVRYDKVRGSSKEQHTSVTGEGFEANLPSGQYTIEIERGKEYHSLSMSLTVGDQRLEKTFELRRWINMAERGWYSGETHVHRTMEDLPTLVLAEDLNVTFPLNYWVTKAFQPPSSGDRRLEEDGKLVTVDPSHVIYPRNTEYEIFSVNGKRHMLGAVFLLNHKSILTEGAPPLSKIADLAHDEGALLELDKHNWPWSMAIIPIMKVDLYELTNNHIWRADFQFRDWGEPAPEYMGLEVSAEGFTERQWIEFGFQNYYALLNCGLKMRPTAGTASGVHPVPLGFGRVYVHLPNGFDYQAWVAGLNQGQSFVTTGPMLFATIDGHESGDCAVFDEPRDVVVRGRVEADGPVSRIELIQNGEIKSAFNPTDQKPLGQRNVIEFAMQASVAESSWLVVRAYQENKGRTRFVHSAPFHFSISDRPLRPRRVERDYLAGRVSEQIERSSGVLPESAIAEYREALRFYQSLNVRD